jgi:sulfate adenylyltransferase subunit 1
VPGAAQSATSAGAASGVDETLDLGLALGLDKELLRFTTAGSVDDGKSTLIGRLLHDSKAIYEDQLASVRGSRFNRSGGPIDFALLTDGLRAEREQGITIDVAYRYFETPARKFIIADTPGHEQYTRNMATGASTADLAIILVDATRGVQAQTRRHAYIASLLGIVNVVAAINKMDLVGYSEDVFSRLNDEFLVLSRQLGIERVVGIPISALAGDNIINLSDRTPWYQGPTLLRHLESVPVRLHTRQEPVRFPVQFVLRPDASFRGFAGQLASGTIRPGDALLALPSRRTTRVRSIVGFDGEKSEAFAPMSTTLTLEDEIDLSRGDILVSPDAPPEVSSHLEAMVVWLDAKPMALGHSYLIKHNVRSSRAKATKIRFRMNMNTLEREPAPELHMNDIAAVEFETASPLFFDPYKRNRVTGSFILIDPISNATVGAAMIERELAPQTDHAFQDVRAAKPEASPVTAPLTSEDRYRRHGHYPAVIFAGNRLALARSLQSALFARGFEVLHLAGAELSAERLETVLSLANSLGLVVILSLEKSQEVQDSRRQLPWKQLAAEHGFRFTFDLPEQTLPLDDAAAVQSVLALLSPVLLPVDRDRGN